MPGPPLEHPSDRDEGPQWPGPEGRQPPGEAGVQPPPRGGFQGPEGPLLPPDKSSDGFWLAASELYREALLLAS